MSSSSFLEIITHFLHLKELTTIVHDYLDLDDLYLLCYPLSKPFLKQRANKSLGCTFKLWIDRVSTPNPIYHNMLTAFILYKKIAPPLHPYIIAHLPPFLRMLSLVYVKDTHKNYHLDCFASADIVTLPLVYKRVFKAIKIDFNTVMASALIHHCATDPELSSIIIENPGFDDTAADLHLWCFIQHDNITFTLIILERFTVHDKTLIRALTRALEHKLDPVIDVILPQVNLNWYLDELHDVFTAAIKYHHKYIPALLARKRFHQGYHYNGHMNILTQLPKEYFSMIYVARGYDDSDIQCYLTRYYTNPLDQISGRFYF